MPSLFRLLLMVGVLVGAGLGGLYLLAEFFEPDQKEVTQSVSGVKIRK